MMSSKDKSSGWNHETMRSFVFGFDNFVPGFCRGHGAVKFVPLVYVVEFGAQSFIRGVGHKRGAGKVASGGTTAFLTAAWEKSKQGVVAEAVQEGAVQMVRALPLWLPERGEAAKVAAGSAPAAFPHQLLQMCGIKVDQGLPLQPENLIQLHQLLA
jgi:hypothetical protein